MKEYEYEILVCYNRECNLGRNYHKVVRIKATSEENACKMIDNYEVDGLFDSIEGDYIEDSLHSLAVLSK